MSSGAAFVCSQASSVNASEYKAVLRGVGVGDPVLARRSRPLRDYLTIRDTWHANCVRISLHPGVWREARRDARASLRQEVGAARGAGMSVVLVWHVIGWPDGRFEQPRDDWGLPRNVYDSDVGLAVSFWDEIAREYADDPEVIFELWNEPVDLDEMTEPLNPGRDWARLRPVWEELLGSVRQHAMNRVLVTGGRWAADLTGIRHARLEGSNIGYAWHVYPPTIDVYPHAIDTSIGYAEWLLDGLHEEESVFVTEWGFYSNQANLGEAFARDILDRLNLPWTAWCWHPKWSPALLEKDWATPTIAGTLVQRKLAG